MYTVFVELKGNAAAKTLAELKRRLTGHDGVERVKLLASCDDPSRYLIVCVCAQVPALSWPEGARVWTFEEAAG